MYLSVVRKVLRPGSKLGKFMQRGSYCIVDRPCFPTCQIS